MNAYLPYLEKPILMITSVLHACMLPLCAEIAAPIFTYPLHADGGLIYDPLRREAEKTGGLARYADAPTQECVVRSGKIEARFRVPMGARL